jgi:phosphoribosylcarboxyaminoimidazole (NCAIR) mutase
MANDKPLVAVVMGSTSDAEIMRGSMEQLKQLNIPYEVKITSAHRTPYQTKEYVESAMAGALR